MCSESDLKEVVSRLRDWFRVLHENGNHKRVKIQKPEKNSESRDINTKRPILRYRLAVPTVAHFFNLSPAEFEVGASPICKDPLGWMFSRLDTNFDVQLDQSEIKSLYLDRNEPCSDAFFKSCDTRADKIITSSEWCTCFQRHTGTVVSPHSTCRYKHGYLLIQFIQPLITFFSKNHRVMPSACCKMYHKN